MEVSALESFDPTEEPVLYRHMIAFRARADRLGDNIERGVAVKVRISDYIRSVSPVPGLLGPDPDSGEAFVVPIDRLLRDPQLESLLTELYGRQNLRERWTRDLLMIADSLSIALEGRS